MKSQRLPNRSVARLLRVGIALLAVHLVSAFGHAQDFSARGRNNLLAADNSEAVLMLNSGRVVAGKVRQVSTGYLVSSRSGYVAVLADDVRFAANDLSELYILQKRELKDPSVKEQLKLAEWCFTQKLTSYATKEFLSILERDPSNETARRMLSRLDENQQRDNVSQPNGSRDTSLKKLADDDARSLAGLSGSTAHQFVTAIQPLLHNKCGNGKCHGTNASSEFRLTHGGTGGGNHRLYSERNLAAVLKYVDLNRPPESRLLKVAQGAHGGQTIFTGRSGADQQKLLTDWVIAAARDLNPKSTSKSPPPVFTATTTKPMPTATSDLESRLTAAEKSNFRKVLEAAESDAFDPEEFNRQFSVPGRR